MVAKDDARRHEVNVRAMRLKSILDIDLLVRYIKYLLTKIAMNQKVKHKIQG